MAAFYRSLPTPPKVYAGPIIEWKYGEFSMLGVCVFLTEVISRGTTCESSQKIIWRNIAGQLGEFRQTRGGAPLQLVGTPSFLWVPKGIFCGTQRPCVYLSVDTSIYMLPSTEVC